MSYILVLDIGTTNLKALAFSEEGELLERREERTKPLYPEQGWVEQNPGEIIDTVYDLIHGVQKKLGDPLGLALTNQRSTTTVWDRETGEPLHNMITWQDTRTKEIVEKFSSKFKIRIGKKVGSLFKVCSRFLPFIRDSKRGAYLITLANLDFGTTHSSMHLRWMTQNDRDVERAINSGRALFGTLDTWVAWNLTGNHVTDYTNASATGIFDPTYLKWSDNVLDLIEVPKKIFPELRTNDIPIGPTNDFDFPLLTMIADQQSSLYMSGVLRGTVNVTSGTGSFIDFNVGEKIWPGGVGLYPMVAIRTQNEIRYLLEGMVNSTGLAIDWLKNIGFMEDYSDISEAFQEESIGGEPVFIPALSGLSSPYVRPDIKGAIFNVTQDTGKMDFVRSLIKGISMRCSEVIKSLREITGIDVERVIAEGGASESDNLLQLMSDLSGLKISRPDFLNGSAYGAYMLAKSVHQGEDPIQSWIPPELEKTFRPSGDQHTEFKESWEEAMEKLRTKRGS